jgi:TRAP-type C4-dicarboxylate transport system substrate-binding protein
MMKKTVGAAALGAAIALTTAFTGSAFARELRIEPGLPCSHDLVKAYEYAEQELPKRTNGELTLRNYCSSLMSLKEMSDGLRDGIADIGLTVLPYWPAEFPYNNFLSNISGFADSAVAISGANTEFVLNCEPCKQEFANKNQVVLAMYGNPPYVPIVNGDAMRDPEDIVGKKFRAGSIFFRRWTEYFDGKALSMSGNEIYEGLNAGVLDATLSTPTEIPNFGLQDVITSVTRMPIGTFHSMSLWAVNRDTWMSLKPEHRKVLMDLAAESTAYALTHLDKQYSEVFDQLEGWGVELVEPSPALLAKQKAFAESNFEESIKTGKEDFGVENAREAAEQFAETARRWQKMMADDIDRTDWKAVADLYKREIYSKIDAQNYGM